MWPIPAIFGGSFDIAHGLGGPGLEMSKGGGLGGCILNLGNDSRVLLAVEDDHEKEGRVLLADDFVWQTIDKCNAYAEQLQERLGLRARS